MAIVGASLAGLAAVRALRRQSFAGEIVVVGAEPHLPYDRPPLSKDFLTGAVTVTDLALTHDGEDLGADWRLGVTATGFDPRTRAVHLDTGEVIRADGVVIATGARARPIEHLGVHTLRTLDDALALREALKQTGRLVVIGAGFIGAEVASSARKLGWDVTVVESLPTPLAGQLGTEMGEIVSRLHGDHGVRLLTGLPVTGLTGTDRIEAVELADGTRLPADLVVAGIGAIPNVEWLESAGGLAAATSVPGVVATGDCTGSQHWTFALEHPATAVAELLGTDPPVTKPPYFWSDQYGVMIQFAGHHAPGDTVRIVEGDPERRSFLAVYERDGQPSAVLGLNQPKLFTRWRRQLRSAPQEA
ncbi:NAD(P)/FAD-dependent oxidoreductase [Actinoplanes xinjiangensis]|uniref:NAD(P)/FAD-dependent oxidoreductase n=1 Tax=Actinoplanes xinjiangensis TaxID=512350 RepID=UPI001EF33E91|nr:FAD-dependent oxidoreductase [Actinoplanes xinjiangensis]